MAVKRTTEPAKPAEETYGIMAGALAALYAQMTGAAASL